MITSELILKTIQNQFGMCLADDIEDNFEKLVVLLDKFLTEIRLEEKEL